LRRLPTSENNIGYSQAIPPYTYKESNTTVSTLPDFSIPVSLIFPINTASL